VVETETDEPKAGCGCQAGVDADGSPALLLIPLLAWLVRRRRR